MSNFEYIDNSFCISVIFSEWFVWKNYSTGQSGSLLKWNCSETTSRTTSFKIQVWKFKNLQKKHFMWWMGALLFFNDSGKHLSYDQRCLRFGRIEKTINHLLLSVIWRFKFWIYLQSPHLWVHSQVTLFIAI